MMTYITATILCLLSATLAGGWYYNKHYSKNLFSDRDKRASSMAITIAFAACASKGKINDLEVDIIKNWAHENIPDSQNDRKFHKALTATRAFFHAGNKIDTEGICNELIQTTSPVQRYSILELCMHVVAADNMATAKELVFLRHISELLHCDPVKVSMMMESMVPVNIHQVKDAEFILGISNLMTPEDARDKLNREYRKWNGRITNPDNKIRSQAKLMIELITNLKKEKLCT